MKEVFLALKEEKSMSGPFGDGCPGMCVARWIYDVGLISQFVNGGWSVYRCNGFQLIEKVIVELKMRKEDGCNECSEPPKPDNECGR